MPIDSTEKRLFDAIDGNCSIGGIVERTLPSPQTRSQLDMAGTFFEKTLVIRSGGVRRVAVRCTKRGELEVSEIQEILTRFWDQLIAQPSGPLAFRLILQPIMAAILAILDGLKDARAGRPLYTWTILTDPAQRASYLREGLKRVCRVIIFALVMDAIYQFLVLRWFYLGEALVTAFVLAVLPYLLIRGPAARIARHWHRRGAAYDKAR